MKIDLVLIASDINPLYTAMWPLIKEAWNDVCGIEAKLILIGDHIPNDLELYKDSIIMFKPIENMHTAYQAQVIRLLYPALIPNKNILISDMDIIPARREYFVDHVIKIPDGKFVSYRDAYMKKQHMIAICYNLAHTNLWKNLFGIETVEDVRNKLQEWYNPLYDGKKNCEGWFTDQKQLYHHIMNWSERLDRHVILFDEDTEFCRLDKRDKNFILHNQDYIFEMLGKKHYSDFHFIRPPMKFQSFIRKAKKTIADNYVDKN